MYLTTSIPHQYLFPLPNHENAVPEHYYSSSEGSDVQSCIAPPTAEAFISDGSPDSTIGSLAAHDEPYMPPRSQATTTANPSPLHYTLPPDYVATQIGHSISRDQYRNYAEGYHAQTGSYPPQYHQHRSSYQQQAPQDEYVYWDDPPYIPPGFTPPPPLAMQARSHFTRLLSANQQPPPPPPPPPTSRQLIAPQSAYDLPSSPSSSESSLASYAPNYVPRHHQFHHHQQHSHQHPHQHQPHNQSQSFPPSPSAIPIQAESHASLSPAAADAPIPPPEIPQHDFSQSPIPEPGKDEGEEVPRSHQWHETDKYLRNQIGIPEGTRVDLWALPDPSPGQKPQQPLPILVKLAIHGSDKGMLTLQEIYQTLEERFEYFARLKSSAWKNSIRHNLSLNQVFRSCDRPITEPGKGRYWSVDISKGEGYKRERRRKRRNAAPYNGTRDLPGGLGNQLNNNNSQADSSDGDQDMEDGAGSMSESVTLKVPAAKKVRGMGGRRGPYTRVTVAQPSIHPGHASASVSPTLGTPTATALTGAGASGMMYSTSSMPSMSSMGAGMAEPGSSSLQAPNMHGGVPAATATADPSSSSRPSAMPTPFYQAAYGFTRAAMPRFGQPSLTAPATFHSSPPQSSRGGMMAQYMTPGGPSARMEEGGGGGTSPTPISISSDSGSEGSENGRMMMGV